MLDNDVFTTDKERDIHVAEALVLLASGVPILCLLAALDKPLELRKDPGKRFPGNPVQSDSLQTLAVLAGLAAGDIDLVSRFGLSLEAALGFPSTHDTGAMRPLITLLLLGHGAAHGSGDVDAMHTVFQRLFGDAKRARLACGVQALMLLPPSSVAQAAVKQQGTGSNGGKRGSLQLKADDAEAAVRESVLASANNDKAESEWKAAKEQVDVIQADITGPNTDDLSNAKARLEACKAAKVEATKEAFDKKKTAAQKEAILAAATFVSKEDDEGGAECATATSRRRCLRDAIRVLLLDEESNGNAACRAALRCMVGDYQPLEVLLPALHQFPHRKLEILRGLLMSRSVTTHQIGRKNAKKGSEYSALCRALVHSDYPDHVDALRAAIESARGESRELVDLISLVLEGAKAAKEDRTKGGDDDDEVSAEYSDGLAKWEDAAKRCCQETEDELRAMSEDPAGADALASEVGFVHGKSKSNGSKYTAVEVRKQGALLWEIAHGDLLGATDSSKNACVELFTQLLPEHSTDFPIHDLAEFVRERRFSEEHKFKEKKIKLTRQYIAEQVVDAIRGIAGVINADERATDELLDLNLLNINDKKQGRPRKSAAKVMFAAARGRVTPQHIKLLHQDEATARILGDAVNAAIGEFARAKQLDALQRVVCWLGKKEGAQSPNDGQKYMFPALLITLVTGEKTYLPDDYDDSRDGKNARAQPVDKDGRLEDRTKELVCEMFTEVGIGGLEQDKNKAFKLSLWALLTGERAAFRSACAELMLSEKNQGTKHGALAPVLSLVTAQDEELTQTFIADQLNPIAQHAVEEVRDKMTATASGRAAVRRAYNISEPLSPNPHGFEDVLREVDRVEEALQEVDREHVLPGRLVGRQLQFDLPGGGSVRLEPTSDNKKWRVRTTLSIRLPSAAAKVKFGNSPDYLEEAARFAKHSPTRGSPHRVFGEEISNEEVKLVELTFGLHELLAALASTLTGDFKSYMKLIGGGGDAISEAGAKRMDKQTGIYQPLIEQLNMTPLFKMISSLASGRAEGVAAQIDAVVELACTLTNAGDQTLSTLQAASPSRTLSASQAGDETALQAAQLDEQKQLRRKASIAAFSAWVRGFSRLMRREPVPPELITEMAKGIQLIMNEPTEGGLAGASVGLALAFEGVLGVLDGDIEAFARLAAMFGAQDEKATTQAVLTIISRFRAAFDARKEASAPKSLNSTMNRGKEMATAMVLDQLFMAISKGDGVISFDDFRELCKFLHLHLTREEAARVFALADASSTGGIDRNEFAGTLQIIAHRVVAQVLERLHISPEYLVFFFVYTVTALVLLLAFIFTGIFAFATGTDFGAVVNSILPIGGGACLGQNPQDPSQLKELIETVVQSVLKDMQV